MFTNFNVHNKWSLATCIRLFVKAGIGCEMLITYGFLNNNKNCFFWISMITMLLWPHRYYFYLLFFCSRILEKIRTILWHSCINWRLKLLLLGSMVCLFCSFSFQDLKRWLDIYIMGLSFWVPPFASIKRKPPKNRAWCKKFPRTSIHFCWCSLVI